MGKIAGVLTPHKDDSQGFTLLEILVAIVIISMVTMIMAFAIRLFIKAWDRGQKEGDNFQVKVSVPALIQNQLGSLVKEKIFQSGKQSEKLSFMGTDKTLSFFTTHIPGILSGKRGLYRVSYIYDKDTGVLNIYQQLITTAGDLSDEFNPLSDEWNQEMKPKGIIHGIQKFSIAYATGTVIEPEKEEAWIDDWKKSKNKIPVGLKIILQMNQNNDKSDEDESEGLWYFEVRSGL